MLTASVLQILADGEFHSGSDLAQRFAVSRTAISNVVRKLCDQGLPINAATKRGYQLPGGFEALAVPTLQTYLPAEITIETHFSLPSTNQHCLDQARAGVKAPQLIFAECQTAGRGRRGRDWCSPLGGNLYGSLLWNFDSGVTQLAGLSLAVGVCIAEVLTACAVPDVRLKWPNDVLIADRKLAGVLIELQGDLSGPTTVVVGVGLNYALHATHSTTINQAWTDLSSVMPQPPTRNALAGQLWIAIIKCLQTFPYTGLNAYQERWQRFDCLQQQQVNIHTGPEILHGLCKGIDSNGSLLVEHNHQLHSYSSGDVSVRSITT